MEQATGTGTQKAPAAIWKEAFGGSPAIGLAKPYRDRAVINRPWPMRTWPVIGRRRGRGCRFRMGVAAMHQYCPDSVPFRREGDRARTQGGIQGKGGAIQALAF
jgi:hypothetical protein